LWKPVKSTVEATLEELDELLEGVEKEADVAEKMEASIARVTINDHVTGTCTRMAASCWLFMSSKRFSNLLK
jgi:hypothetical protein